MMKFKQWMMLFAVLAFAKAYPQSSPQTKTKVEQESRISLEQMDEAAKSLVQQLGAKLSRIKLYKELDGSKKSYEAKFKVSRQKYSVEFNENWRLEDIEINASRRDVVDDLWLQIHGQLDTMARKWRLEKLQLQYLPVADNTVNQTQRIQNNLFDNLELIVAFKDNGAVYRRELLFSKTGVLLKQRDVKKRKYDFLLF